MNLIYFWAKFFKKIRGVAIKDCNIHKTSKIQSGSHVINSIFGRHSYCGYDCEIINTEVGSFCSIANNVIIGGSSHPVEWVTTSPVFIEGRHSSLKKKYTEHHYKNNIRTTIGNDVWIGNFVLIKQGVKIGDGAVIGMGSVVTKDVAPYSIVGGSPARLIRMRFDDVTVEGLLKSQWWNWDDERMARKAKYFNEVQMFLEEIKEEK